MPRSPWRRSGIAALLAVGVVGACSTRSGVHTEEAAQVAPPPATAADPPPATTPPTTDRVDDDPPPPTTDDAGGDAGGDEGGADDSSSIEWFDLGNQIEQGLLEVPVDYDDPTGDTFTLFLVRRQADDQANKVGSLLINPGGPGAGGANFAAGAEFIFDDALLERFDIVGWDPRGTGYTDPAIDCIDDYDRYYAYDVTPDDDAERQQIVDLAQQYEDQCESNNGDILQHVGTNDSARDMDSIREALGEDTISYFGFSYGSELGATWATLFPDTVRAAVLDGAADPTVGLVEGGLQQVQGFEGTVSTYLAQCSADIDCAFHNRGDAEGAFDQLMAALDEDPAPSEPGRPDVDIGIARQAVAKAMYDDATWPQLSQALADAQDGDGEGLLTLYDSYYGRMPDGTWPNFLEAFQVISCMDETERPTVAEDDANALRGHELAPRMAPGTSGDYFCTFFPPTENPRVTITGAGAGPIVVVGTTGDPATPLASTRVMADTLEDGRLIVVTADKHTGYGESECGDDVIHRYLLDLEVPPEETNC